MFHDSYLAVMNHVRHENTTIYKVVNIDSGKLVATTIDSLSAFWPGMQVLAGDVPHAIRLHHYFFTIWRRYGAVPEAFDFVSSTHTAANYPLRPELIESTYMLYRATRNAYYLEVGASMLRDIENIMRTKCGFATVADLTRGTLHDRMESFFLAETLKYLYMLFDVENPFNTLDSNWVFNTGLFLISFLATDRVEGHVLPLDAKYLRKKSKKFTEKVYVCKKNTWKPLEKTHQFEQIDSVSLPLPIEEIKKMYHDIGVDHKTDLFYNTVIKRIHENTYYQQESYLDQVCDARPLPAPLDLKYVPQAQPPRRYRFEDEDDDISRHLARVLYKYTHKKFFSGLPSFVVSILWDIIMIFVLYRACVAAHSLWKAIRS